MKNFVKKLACCLALIMVAGLLAPAAVSNAAALPAMNKKSRSLYVNGSKINGAKATYTLQVKNRPVKYTTEWVSSNPKVATVTKSTKGRGKVTALAIGTTTITCKMKDNASGKIYTLKSKIKVSKNAASVKLNAEKLPEKMGVGETAQLTGTMYDDKGNAGTSGQYVSDYLNFSSSNPAVATVDSKGLLTAVSSGTATISIYSYQSGKYKDEKYATAKDSVNVTVSAGIASVTQTTLNKLDVAFDMVMKDTVTKDNIKVSKQVLGTASTDVPVKSLTWDATGKIATVELLLSLDDGYQYTVTYSNLSKTITASKGPIVRVQPYTANGANTAVIKTNEKVYYRFFDAKGIDVTPVDSSGYMTLAAKVTLDYADTSTNTNFLLDQSQGAVYFIEAGKTGLIRATYHTGVFDTTGEVGNVIGTAAITSVKASSSITVSDWMITPLKNAGAELDWTKASKQLAAEDTDYRLVVKAVDSNGNTVYSNSAESKFSFAASSPTSNIIVDPLTGILYPMTEGSTEIVVSYEGDVKSVCKVSVVPKRQVTKLELDTYSALVSDVSGVDELKLTLSAKDQMNETIKIAATGDVTVSSRSSAGPLAYPAVVNSDGTVTILLYGVGWGTRDGKPYTYDVSYGGKTTGFSVTVKTPTGTASNYQLDIPGKIDMKIGADGVMPEVDIGLYEYKNGVKYSKISGIKPSTDTSIVEGNYYYIILLNGVEVRTGTATDKFLAAAYSGSTITKAAAGSYRVTAYRKNAVGATTVATATFILNDTQEAPTLKVLKNTTSANIAPGMSLASIVDIIQNCYEIKIGGEFVSAANITPEVTIVGTTGIYVKSLDITQPVTINGVTCYLKHKLLVGQNINYVN